MLSLPNKPKIFSPVVLIHDLSKTGFPKCDDNSPNGKDDSPAHSGCSKCLKNPGCTEEEQLTQSLFNRCQQMALWHPLFLRHLYPDHFLLHPPVASCNSRFSLRSSDSPNQQDFVKTDSNKLKQKEKPFACPFCSVKCRNRGQLRGHIRIHTGERPYVCDSPGCNKSFKRKEELTRHNRIHTDERPHCCRSCGKSFTRKDHLTKHMQIHNHDDEDIFQFMTH